MGIDGEEFNITVIVLTMIAAVALVSFIGVFIGVVILIARRQSRQLKDKPARNQLGHNEDAISS